MSADMLPLAGAVAGLRMLVDGTIAVTLHFEPKDRTEAMKMLGEPGAMVGVVRLKDGTGAAPAPAPRPDPRGPLCMEAIGLCNNESFQKFIGHDAATGYHWKQTPEAAKGFILSWCGVESRKDLDHDPDAAQRFTGLQRTFRSWVARQP